MFRLASRQGVYGQCLWWSRTEGLGPAGDRAQQDRREGLGPGRPTLPSEFPWWERAVRVTCRQEAPAPAAPGGPEEGRTLVLAACRVSLTEGRLPPQSTPSLSRLCTCYTLASNLVPPHRTPHLPASEPQRANPLLPSGLWAAAPAEPLLGSLGSRCSSFVPSLSDSRPGRIH